MTTKQKQNRKNLIKKSATKMKMQDNKKPTEEIAQQDAFAEAKADAYRLENEGRWDEAVIVWGQALDWATTEKAKKQAAGRKAAAKVRASAAAQAIEEQMKVQIASEQESAKKQAALVIDETETETETETEESYTPAIINTLTGEALQVAYRKVLDENPPAGARENVMRQRIIAELKAQAAADADESDDKEVTRASEEAEEQKAPKAPKAPKVQTRDERLPPAGATVVKTDRHGAERCRCKVVADGFEYDGKTYKSLSAAGLAAMAALGMTSTTCDGFAFWGLKKGERPAKTPKPPKPPKDTVKSLLALARGVLNKFGFPQVSDDEVSKLIARIDVVLPVEPEQQAEPQAEPQAETEIEIEVEV